MCCIGKSYIIAKEAKKHKHKLCHIPIKITGNLEDNCD